MSQLSAVPEHRPCESPFEQQLSGVSSVDDGSPKRSAHPTARRASSTGKLFQRQLSIDSQMSASIRKMAPAELPSTRCVFLEFLQQVLACQAISAPAHGKCTTVPWQLALWMHNTCLYKPPTSLCHQDLQPNSFVSSRPKPHKRLTTMAMFPADKRRPGSSRIALASSYCLALFAGSSSHMCGAGWNPPAIQI